METLEANPFEFNEDDITILEGFGTMYDFGFCLPPFQDAMKNPFYYVNSTKDKKYHKLLLALHYAGYFTKTHTIKRKKYMEVFKSEDLAADVG